MCCCTDKTPWHVRVWNKIKKTEEAAEEGGKRVDEVEVLLDQVQVSGPGWAGLVLVWCWYWDRESGGVSNVPFGGSVLES